MFAGNTAINKIISPKADTFFYLIRILFQKIIQKNSLYSKAEGAGNDRAQL